MDFTIKIDITERLEKSLHALAKALLFSGTSKTLSEYVKGTPENSEPEKDNVFVGYTINIPYEQAGTPSEPENAPEAKSEQPVAEKPDAVEAPAQNDNAEPKPEQPEKKPAKKRASKKAENLPVETPKEPAPINTPVEPENVPEAKSEQPAVEKPEPSEPKASDDDPMCGMTVMEAMQAVIDEISEKGLDMADVNARVRARAAEAGIAYSSIICLIKAIGYKEARRVALGDK